MIFKNASVGVQEKFITKTIKNLTNTYVTKYLVLFDDINKGLCGEFAESVYDILTKVGISCEIMSETLFYDEDEDPELLLNVKDYSVIVPDPFEGFRLPCHYWIYSNGKHYDCECPDGTTNMFELPIIKKVYFKNILTKISKYDMVIL